MNTIRRNTEALIDASKVIGLELSTEKTKHMLMSHHQNAGQRHNIKIAIDPLKMWQSSNTWE
jgi:hypothetical protein